MISAGFGFLPTVLTSSWMTSAVIASHLAVQPVGPARPTPVRPRLSLARKQPVFKSRRGATGPMQRRCNVELPKFSPSAPSPLQEDQMTVYEAPGQAGSPVEFKSRYDHFIGGEWVSPAKGGYFE